jgi:hypothetical protein
MRGTPAAAVALLVTVAATCAPPPPDLVLLNAHIFTADPSRPFAEAVAIRGNRIVAVGSTAEVTPLVGRSTVVRDLGGRAVIPGLNDAHVIDPGLTGPALLGFAAMAAAVGVTSMQWFVGERTVRDVGAVLVAADIPQRIRVLRMPRPGPEGTTIDSRPHLPPQPTPRVDIRGMGFTIGQGSGERLRQAVGWAYGSEDLLAVEPQSDAVLAEYVDTVDRVGLEEVWARKRPRVERAGMMATSLAPRLRAHGMVVVQRPDGPAPLASLVDQDVHLALGSGTGTDPYGVLAWATSPERGPEALTREQAIVALTREAAYAELSERDKGHLSVGALADLTVPSIDPFSAPARDLLRARSLITVIGGRMVHDVP